MTQEQFARRSLLTVALLTLALFVGAPGLHAVAINPEPSWESITVSANVGPIDVPDVPVEVCLNTTCVSTPDLSNFSLQVTATVDVTVEAPTMSVRTCGSFAGASVTTSTGATAATVVATVSGTLPDGTPYEQSLGPVSAPPFSKTEASACVD